MTPDPRHGHLDEWQGRLICHECGRAYLHLATHARAGHALTAEAYREKHGLGRSTSLVAPAIAAGMSERSSRPERLAHLAAVRDVDALRAHQGRPSWRPEVVRKAVERGEARRREIPVALLEALAPWEDVRAWAAGAHSIVAQGYSATELARALERSEPTVRQRLRRHPPA